MYDVTIERQAWDAKFTSPKQYIKQKLKMLRNDMRINLTDDEVLHLKSLKTQGDIDRAAITIINRHWDEDDAK